MNAPKIRIYICRHADECMHNGLCDVDYVCPFSKLHTSSTRCKCDFYEAEEIHNGM